VKIDSLFSTSVELAGFLLLIVLLAAPMAGAQEMDLPAGVPDRVAPESDSLGTRLGGFTAYPKLGLSTAYDSNIFAIDSQVESDARFVIDPSFAVESNWSSNELSLGGFLSSSIFADNTTEDKLDWGFGTSGQLDVLEGSNVKGMLGYQRLTEDRGGIDAVAVPDPVDYGHLQAGLVGNHRINQLTLSGGADFQRFDYDPSSQKFRDRDLWTATGQGGYTFSPGYSGFFRGEFSDRNFQNRANPLPLPAQRPTPTPKRTEDLADIDLDFLDFGRPRDRKVLGLFQKRCLLRYLARALRVPCDPWCLLVLESNAKGDLIPGEVLTGHIRVAVFETVEQIEVNESRQPIVGPQRDAKAVVVPVNPLVIAVVEPEIELQVGFRGQFVVHPEACIGIEDAA